MRISEIILESRDLSDLIEDDTDHEALDQLISTLREIQFSADHAEIPKISVEALINLVNSKPGGESFDFDALNSAKQNNEAVKNIIGDIKDDERGIKYVFIKPAEPDEETPETGSDSEAVKTAPEKTVSSMAKRAARARD